MKQQLNIFLILLVFASFTLNAQQVRTETRGIQMCDTTRKVFLKKSIKMANSLNNSSKLVFQLYEGNSYYRPAFSFILWELKQKKKYKIIVDRKNYVNTAASLNKYYFLPVIVLWLILDFKYFSKSKVQTIITQYEKKKVQEKRFWAIITIISLTIPFIIIPVLLIK